VGACVRTRLYLLCTALHVSLSTHFINYFPSSKSFCFSRKKIGEGTRNSAGARALLVAIHKLRVVLIVLRPQLSVDRPARLPVPHFSPCRPGRRRWVFALGLGSIGRGGADPPASHHRPAVLGGGVECTPARLPHKLRARGRVWDFFVDRSCTGGYK
jgi:hypothetical protein